MNYYIEPCEEICYELLDLTLPHLPAESNARKAFDHHGASISSSSSKNGPSDAPLFHLASFRNESSSLRRQERERRSLH